jgi:glycosyltransferase involved in cell wall biosynthesis
MNIGLLLQADRSWLGGVDYIRNLILALGNLPPNEQQGLQLTLISDFPLDPELGRVLEPHLHVNVDRTGGLPKRTLTNRLIWLARRHLQGQNDPRFSRFCKDAGIEFVYPFQGSPGKGSNFNSAAWIPDFQHLHLPHFFTPEEIRQRDEQFASLANTASRVVLSSESAAADFRKRYPAQAGKARILRFAVWPDPGWSVGDPLAVQAAYNLPDRFFLICNQMWQHKNHLLVLDALRQLKARGIHPVLVCTGHIHDYRNPGFTDQVLQAIHHFGLNSQVRLLGLIPRAEQIQLMRRCLAVIQPSLFEGWSTIVEFAKSLGRPLILSDLPVHQEQSPGSLFFHRESSSDLASLLASAWKNFTPGPDLNQETDSCAAAQARCREFAHNFLAIAAAK